MWWSFVPYLTSRWMQAAILESSDWKKWSTSSFGMSSILGFSSPDFIASDILTYGRRTMSTVASASASSSGTDACPKRVMPSRLPSASSMAVPTAIAVSSIRWCAMPSSDSAFTVRSTVACFANDASRWSRKRTPVLMSGPPPFLSPPSTSTDTDTAVSFVARLTSARRPLPSPGCVIPPIASL